MFFDHVDINGLAVLTHLHAKRHGEGGVSLLDRSRDLQIAELNYRDPCIS